MIDAMAYTFHLPHINLRECDWEGGEYPSINPLFLGFLYKPGLSGIFCPSTLQFIQTGVLVFASAKVKIQFTEHYFGGGEDDCRAKMSPPRYIAS